MLRREIERFDPALPLERASTPPSSWFLDPAFLELERRTVFRRTWQAAGRLDQVAEAGAYFTAEVAGEPCAVVRDGEGRLRAFYNVCRHHAACVLEGGGKVEELVCPYHGWTYRLDGRLRRAPGLGRVEGFERERFGLVPVGVQGWGPFVFLHLGKDPRPLELEPLEGRLDTGGLRFATRRTYEIACNWKVFVDNYLDGGYHVPHLHGALSSQLDLADYRTEIFERLSVQKCRAGGEGDFPERLGEGAVYAWIYPNFMINRYGPAMDTNLVLPLGPQRTLTVFDYYFAEGTDPGFIERCLEASHRVQEEDVAICQSVQRGLASSAYDTGRYARVEAPDHHFHRLLAEDYRRELGP